MAVDEASSLADALIDYLRSTLNDDSLSYASPPEPVSGGYDTAIYAFSLGGAVGQMAGPLILRVFRDGGAEQARFEAAIQNSVAAQGFGTPRALLLCEDAAVLGGAFTIMPRVDGVMMLDRLFSIGALRIPATLAKLQARLHALDPEPMQLAIKEAGLGELRGATFEGAWGNIIESARLDGLRDSCAWVLANRPPATTHVVCHGDLHPLNVMMRGNDVTGVLDWANARIDDPAWDVGATMALLGHGPVDLAGPLMPVANLARGWLVRRYLKAYMAERPIDLPSVRFFEATRLLGFLVEVGVVRQSRAGVAPPTTKPTAFESPRVLSGIVRRFAKITGVTPSLPAAT